MSVHGDLESISPGLVICVSRGALVTGSAVLVASALVPNVVVPLPSVTVVTVVVCPFPKPVLASLSLLPELTYGSILRSISSLPGSCHV